MNVEIGAEAALFPEKEYIYGIAVAVCSMSDKTYYVEVTIMERLDQGSLHTSKMRPETDMH
jgi:hypothetical protein